MKVDNLTETIDIPEGAQITAADGLLTISGALGSSSRRIDTRRFSIERGDGTVTISLKDATKREKREIYTLAAHVRNMLTGVTEGYEYRLKICSGHFPMNVSAANKKFVIKNFIGEKVPRETPLREGCEVKIDGDIVTVTSHDKEIAGQQAADIEQLTRRPHFDKRIFQDGIYIISKAGKDLK
ncbi:50S ribosomal protein L6 [Candidatus Woesearchaeota archaeon]|nr:50S ribosomal protein L6 [Candidatus Woesearchaeota archaeon]